MGGERCEVVRHSGAVMARVAGGVWNHGAMVVGHSGAVMARDGVAGGAHDPRAYHGAVAPLFPFSWDPIAYYGMRAVGYGVAVG